MMPATILDVLPESSTLTGLLLLLANSIAIVFYITRLLRSRKDSWRNISGWLWAGAPLALHALSSAAAIVTCFISAAAVGESNVRAQLLYLSGALLVLALLTWRLVQSTRWARIERVLVERRSGSFLLPWLFSFYAATGASCIVLYLLSASFSPTLAEELVLSGLRWKVYDKRWVVAAYLLAIGTFVVLPIFLRRLFVELKRYSATRRRGATSVSSVSARTEESPGAEFSGTERAMIKELPSSIVAIKLAGRALARIFLISAGLLAAFHFFGPNFASLKQKFGSHELIHLAGLLAIEQGALPFLEAETQYGPGYQLITHWLMGLGDYSFYGFRLSHLIINLSSMILIFLLYTAVFKWHTAPLLVAITLYISPAVMFSYYGWAVIPRWLGPALIGLLLPVIIIHSDRRIIAFVGTFALGSVAGFLSWFASENLYGSIITFSLILIISWSIFLLETPVFLKMAIIYITSLVTVLHSLVLAACPLGELGSFWELYFRASRMVSRGVSNIPWSKGLDNLWTLPYFMTPYLLILSVILAVYVPELKRVKVEDHRGRLQLIGILSAAMVLHVATMLRADQTHFVGPSLALGASLALLATNLPALLIKSRLRREAFRVLLVLALLAIYPLPVTWSEVQTNLRWKKDPFIEVDRVASVISEYKDRRLVAGGENVFRAPAQKIGFDFKLGDLCCATNQWTYGDLVNLMGSISEYIGARPVVISDFHGLYPSGAYFFSDLKVAVPVEPLISVWVRSDLERWLDRISQSDVDCLITTKDTGPVVDFTRSIFGNFTAIDRSERLGSGDVFQYKIYCRE